MRWLVATTEEETKVVKKEQDEKAAVVRVNRGFLASPRQRPRLRRSPRLNK